MLEPRILPAAAVVPPTSTVAVQTGTQPTNKVAAATNVGSGIAAVIAGVMTIYGGPALVEMLGPWGVAHPNSTAFAVALATAAATWAGVRYGGRGAAYNVLDAPNVAMAPVTSPTAADIRPA
jgi:hypothetical protein